MDTPPNVAFFIEIALFRLGKEIAEGQNLKTRADKAAVVINHYLAKGEITDDIKEGLFKCWGDLAIDVATRDRELAIRRHEGRQDTADVNRETYLCYLGFCSCVSNCLDTLSIA